MSAFKLDVQGDVSVITLQVSFFDEDTFESLRKLALKLSDSPPKIIVLCSSGKDFSHGLALHEGSTLRQKLNVLSNRQDTYRSQEIVAHLRRCVDALMMVPVPVIVAAEGQCSGPGAALALNADILLISDTTTIDFPSTTVGLLDGLGGLGRIIAQTGPGLATEMALSGRKLDATDLTTLGYASQCTPEGKTLEFALVLAEEMLQYAGYVTRREVLMGIRAVRRHQSKPIEEKMVQTAARTIVSGELFQEDK